MKRILSVIALLLLAVGVVSAQGGYLVKGVVEDAQGPVIGATVLQQGTTNGTTTGLDGDFMLRVPDADAIVEISCIGYATQVFKASEVPARILLAEDTEFLDEVVVIGYGTLSKKEVSASIVQVDSKDFFRGTTNNPMTMLTGKVAGLNVVTSQGSNPNSGSDYQIRGATSLQAGNGPLVVIDGVPGGEIRSLAPQDIESMTVLKDAASASIYGTAGANGVILVTTKKGSKDEAGTAHVTYDGAFNVNFVKDPIAVLTPEEWVRSRRGTDYGARTDWYNALLRDFSYGHSHYVGVDGSTAKGSYNASVSYKNSLGVDLVDAREEFGARAAVEQRLIKDILQLNISLNARRVNEEYGNDGSFGTALTINPTFPIYNEDGSYYQPTAPTNATNPVEAMLNKTANGQRLYTTGAVSLKANFIKTDVHNLSSTVTYSLDYNDYKSNNYTPIESHDKYWNGYEGTASLSYSKNWRNQLEWLFNYSFHSGEHHLNAVAGYSYQDFNSESMNMTNRGFTYDSILWNDIGAGTARTENPAQTSMGSGKSLSKVIALLGRVNYNWNNTLFASLSLRHEGATNFGVNNKWGNFPAASIAWEMANMDFMQGVRWITSLKPRVSYGVTGRRGGSNVSRPTYGSHGQYYMDGEWVKGYRPATNANPDLRWEKLVAVNAGIDFVLFNNRLRGSLDLYDRRSPDLLYNYTAPQPPFIHSSILVNVGETQNLGAELSLDGDIIMKKNFSWTSGINASTGYSKIRTLSNQIYGASYIDMLGTGGLGQTSYYYRYTEGSRIGTLYGYEAAGVNEYGDMMVYDNDGNVITAASANAAFKRYIGNTIPKLFLSWNNTFRYKNFDLSIFMNGAFGHMIYNNRRAGNLQSSGNANVFRTAYTRDKDVREYGGVVTSYFLEHGDFMKIQNVSLGYTLTPKSEIIRSLRVFLTATDLYTITGYTGTDPALLSTNGLTPGVDNGTGYPETRVVTLGATVTF
ncbi:MAG: SusC/RagA family TonB-linked outer membrane protein [Bacteroidales bacterium]|nr:SusC/RagA family TonB-linked outer membrane protein [Bacteroidales bacterium]